MPSSPNHHARSETSWQPGQRETGAAEAWDSPVVAGATVTLSPVLAEAQGEARAEVVGRVGIGDEAWSLAQGGTVAQWVRVLACQARGRGFNSRPPRQYFSLL